MTDKLTEDEEKALFEAFKATQDKDERALFEAAIENNTTIINNLISIIGVNVNAKGRVDETPLMVSSIFGNFETTKALLDLNADPNIKAADGTNALIVAAQKNYYKIVELLIERGANVNAQSNDGRTPIAIAAVHEYLDTIEILLKNKADPKINSKLFKSTLEELEKFELDIPKELINLIEIGGDMLLKTYISLIPRTPNHTSILRLLEQYGAEE
jgi:ankyrin repeat protein